MRLMAKITLTAVWVVFGLTSASYADFITHVWEDRFPKSTYGMSLSSEYFQSSSNFSVNGAVVFPSSLKTYAKLQNDLNIDIKVGEHIGFFGRGSWQYVNLNSTAQGGTGFGFADQTLGISYRANGISVDAPLTIDFQGQIDFPGYNNSNSYATSTPYMGDGSVDLTAGVFALIPLKEGNKYKFQILAGGGYTYRSDGYSAAIPWSGYLKLIPQLEGLSADLGMSGFLSMQTDYSPSYSAPHANLASGGSFITGAVDPSLLQLSFKPGYKFGPEAQLDLIGKMSLWGQNIPNSYSIALRFQYLFGHIKEGHIEKKLRSITPIESEPYETKYSAFTTYSMDANIVKTNDRMNLVKINKGSQDGIAVGQIFDVFNVKVNSQAGEVIARGQVTNVKNDEAALEITEFYKEVKIEEGSLARRLIQ